MKAADYLKHFASDRSHMRKEDGGWMAEPPSYPPISTDGRGVTGFRFPTRPTKVVHVLKDL